MRMRSLNKLILQNPNLLASESGNKMVRIQGIRAILKEKDGELSFVIGSKTLVTITGSGTDSSIIIEYANSLDIDLIKSIVEG